MKLFSIIIVFGLFFIFQTEILLTQGTVVTKTINSKSLDDDFLGDSPGRAVEFAGGHVDKVGQGIEEKMLPFFSDILLCAEEFQYDWTVFDTANSGIPSNHVSCIAIDEFNNTWLGTDQGLVKYDGTDWMVYDIKSVDLPEIWFGCIAIDKSNTIWIGTSNRSDGFGLVEFDGTNWTVYDTSNSELPSNQTHRIVVDDLNNKWIATDEGLVKFDGEKWIIYNESNSELPNNSVWRFAIDTDGNKWFFYDGGYDEQKKLVKLQADDSTWTTFTNSDTLSDTRFYDDIAVDALNNIWILSYESSAILEKFDGSNWTVYYDEIKSKHGFSPHSMSIDKENTIWIANYWDGLKKFDGTHWTTYDTTNSAIPSNHGRNIAIDHHNQKWISGFGMGVAVFNENGVPATLDDYISENRTMPQRYHLNQNFPNPFNPVTKIEYTIPRVEQVMIEVFNILGQRVAILVERPMTTGRHQVTFNGASLPSGVYYYRIKAGHYSQVRKMVLVK